MSVKAAILEILSAHAPLVAKVNLKIQPRQSPTKVALPRITYNRLSKQMENECLDDPDCTVVTEVFEITARGATDLEAEEVGDLIEAAIVTADLGDAYAGLTFTRLDVANRSDVTDFPLEQDNRPVCSDAVIVEFTYEKGC